MKRIIIGVIGVHLILLCWMAIASPSAKPKKEVLKVKTIVAKAPSPKKKEEAVVQVQKTEPVTTSPVTKPSPQKKAPIKSQVVATKKQTKKAHRPKISKELAQKLERSLARLDSLPSKEFTSSPLKSPEWISTLKIEKGGEAADHYTEELIDCLQNQLHLPELGQVKVSLTLQSNGRFVNMKVLESGSMRNREFLEGSLKKVIYPHFSGTLSKTKEHTFVITFCNG